MGEGMRREREVKEGEVGTEGRERKKERKGAND